MHPVPDDPAVVVRMQAAHNHARAALSLEPDHSVTAAWGWRGRTLGHAVIGPDGPAWLRVASVLTDQADTTFWDGALHAQDAIPPSVPRPSLRCSHDWHVEPWKYRAELYDRAVHQPLATSPTLHTTPHLPASWWAAVRTALADIAAVPTTRFTIQQRYLDRVMPRFLGEPIDTTAPCWTTAHGDFHFANICAPSLCILDWEGWGLAPAGYDAAVLHSYALLQPASAAEIRHELAHLLDSPTGRFAELAAIAERLHETSHGDNIGLTNTLRERAATLLGRPPAS